MFPHLFAELCLGDFFPVIRTNLNLCTLKDCQSGTLLAVRCFLLSFYSNENLNKWDTTQSGTLFLVRAPKMNLTKWDTLLFESSLADVLIAFQSLLVQNISYCAFFNLVK